MGGVDSLSALSGSRGGFFRRSIAWPNDHGSWVFLLSPLIIGLVAGGRWTTPATYLLVAALSGFLVRQPTTIAVKVLTGRRSRDDLPAAFFWTAFYSLLGGLHVAGLVIRGFGYLLYLAIPGVAVYIWYLSLVARRQERKQVLMEVLAAGVLALTAPAALWVGLGKPAPVGWLLWLLTWAQSAASIIHVHLRLTQRGWQQVPERRALITYGLPALTISTLNLLLVGGLGADGKVAAFLAVAYLPQWLESILGTFRPAIGLKPTSVGLRQLGVSALFTLLFVVFWN